MADPLKNALRQALRGLRGRLSLDYQQNASLKVCERIKALQQYRQARRIALYQATQGEIDLSAIWRSAPMQGKYCYFPSLNDDKTLSFLPATPATSFITNRFGINEPDVARSEAISPHELDIIFLPLVAFDLLGARIGMGAGYYDRTLAGTASPLLVGVAYEFQRQAYLFPQQWDIRLHATITPKHVYWSI
ncbi:5-formyltetrahydrofolate cyclo-ligase [Legionella rubrilucens]|uniref:5-formyltetrahydrofolate cyclo-ligase n=1 Tax=Legionella rubrilucens TaxID=458 RepID=A0A0W0XR64_9GAMM|nr:5-formyltetrahydrofolate cyclo-ligase [Legionella rubrilucens]KTD47065.1 5-formyltetrahydrofolate cyclo-ligase [Legionella rubrilucens]